MEIKKQKKILTYREFCEEYRDWNKDAFRRKVEEDGLPAIKDGKEWLMSRAEVERWFAKKGLKVSDPEIPAVLKWLSKKLKEFPKEPASAIYFLLKDNSIVYIGQSTGLGARLSSHANNKDFDRVFYVEVEKERLSELEVAFIKSIRPPLNSAYSVDATESDREIISRFMETA